MLQLQSTLLIPDDIKCITVQLHTVNSIRFIRHVCTHDKDWSCAGSTDTEYACDNATPVPCLVEGQGHQVRRLLMEQVGHGDRVSDLTLRPCRFQASMYSILHSSRSSAESRHHCLVSVNSGHGLPIKNNTTPIAYTLTKTQIAQDFVLQKASVSSGSSNGLDRHRRTTGNLSNTARAGAGAGRGGADLQTREQLRRSTQSSCEKTREITSAGARSAAGVARSPSFGGGGGGAMADPLSQESPVLGLALEILELSSRLLRV